MKTAQGLAKHAQRALSEKWWYVWGTYGSPLTANLLAQKVKQYPSRNSFQVHSPHLNEMVSDCVGLIKGYCMWDDEKDKPIYKPEYDVNTGGMYQLAKQKGTIDTIPEVPGVCVYMQGHVGVYIGDGQVIECTGGRGVIQTPLKNSYWTHWFECPFIEYPDDNKTYTVLTLADRQELTDKGYFTFDQPVTWTVTCVGRFKTREEALKTADDLNKKGYGGTVMEMEE